MGGADLSVPYRCFGRSLFANAVHARINDTATLLTAIQLGAYAYSGAGGVTSGALLVPVAL
jgi:hypothetical protein